MTNLELATRRLSGNSAACAGARTIIKRTLAKMSLPRTDDVSELAGFFLAHPWACTAAIESRIESSARAWVEGNNSGNPRTLDEQGERSRLLGSHVEALMALLNVEVDWPGLYPTYKTADGYTHYDLAGLWASIKSARIATE